MKKTMMRLTALLLTLSLSIGLVCMNAMAAYQNGGAGTADIQAQTTTYVNPVYQNLINPNDLEKPDPEELDSPDLYAATYYSTVASAGKVLRTQLKKRVKSIQIHYKTKGSYTNLSKSISEYAMEHTRVPTEGDYLKFQYAGWTCETSGYTVLSTGVHYVTLSYTFTYYTTAAQETKMNTAVTSLRSQLNLSGMNTLNKIGTVYDYMCDNIVYDYTHLNDSSYNLKYTGYAALINKTSVCQGYAVLFYRMMLSEKVDCRIISGIGNGGAHSWNIVRIGNKYYDLDATWDASRTQNGRGWLYFMCCDGNFSNHQRGAAYTTSAFAKKFPMSGVDLSDAVMNKMYKNHSSKHFWHKWSDTASTYTATGTKTYVCSVCNKTKKVTIPKRVKLSQLKNVAVRKMKVTWGKNAAASGYQVQYSLSKTFAKGNKTVLIKSPKTVSTVLKGLTKKKVYYVRVRTYKTVSGVKYFSGWSASKHVKVVK